MQLNNLPLCYEILPPAPLNLLLSIKKENMLWFWERACLVFGNRMLYLTSELAGVFGIFARAFFSSGGVHFSGCGWRLSMQLNATKEGSRLCIGKSSFM